LYTVFINRSITPETPRMLQRDFLGWEWVTSAWKPIYSKQKSVYLHSAPSSEKNVIIDKDHLLECPTLNCNSTHILVTTLGWDAEDG
jgi:hypothetical protein